MNLATPANIQFGIVLFGVVFAIYRSYKDPQQKSDTTDAVMREQITVLQESVSRIQNNHLPHIQSRVDDIHDDISTMKTLIAQLSTIIDERVPRVK